MSIPTLLKMVASGRIPAEKMGTHSFTFAQMDEAYDVFKNAAENSALKVAITPARSPHAANPSSVLVAVTTKTDEGSCLCLLRRPAAELRSRLLRHCGTPGGRSPR